MSESKKGKPLSLETRQKLSEMRRGDKSSFFGKHHTEESKKVMRELKVGKPLSDLHRQHLRDSANRGEDNPRYSSVETTCQQCGKTFIKTASQIGRFCSNKCSGIWRSKTAIGEANPNWRGGTSFEPYCPKFNKEFRERVRAWYNYQCVNCGEPERNRKLTVHHVYYQKQACCERNDIGEYLYLIDGEQVQVEGDPNKFVALCLSCHMKTNSERMYWAKYFESVINQWYGGKSYCDTEEWERIRNLELTKM